MNAKQLGTKCGIVAANSVDAVVDVVSNSILATSEAGSAFGAAYKAQREQNAKRRMTVAQPTIVGKRGLKTA